MAAPSPSNKNMSERDVLLKVELCFLIIHHTTLVRLIFSHANFYSRQAAKTCNNLVARQGCQSGKPCMSKPVRSLFCLNGLQLRFSKALLETDESCIRNMLVYKKVVLIVLLEYPFTSESTYSHVASKL